jgi:bacterioferritin
MLVQAARSPLREGIHAATPKNLNTRRHARPAPFPTGHSPPETLLMPHFVQDVEEIRQRAMQKIEDGAVTSTYGLDQDKVIDILNEALATEIVCVLRYMHHYFMATGVHGKAAADEFKEHADAEREHADDIAERIQQLGGKPDFNPRSLLERSVSQYVEGEDLADMIREDLIAERVVIDVYREMIKYFGDKDPTTRIMIEHILEDEEEHASDLSDLLYVVNPSTGKTEVQDPGTEIGKNDNEARMDRQQSGRNRQNQQQRGDSNSSNEQDRNQRRSGDSQSAGKAPQELGNIGGRQRPQPTQTSQAGSRGNARNQQPQFEPREGGGRRDRSEARPARATGNERPAAGRRDIPPAHAPGTTGRVMARRGRNEVAPAEDDVAIGGQTGTSRSPKILEKNRKNKRAA